MHNEETVKNEISKWLEDNGVDVYWEKKNDYGYGVFTTTTGTKKPDLCLIWKNHVVLVEVKDAESFSNVYDAFFQIIGYYNNITTVSIGGKRFNVTGFVVATQYSVCGRLFPSEPIIEFKDFGPGRQKAAIESHLPFSEYKLTEMFTRLLWRSPQLKDMMIGTLVSSRLMYPNSPPVPTILGKQKGHQFFEEVKL